jgi:predicted Zn-dependent protease
MSSRLGFVLLAAVLMACATVKYTGRRQFNLISPQQEMQLGEQSYAEILQQTPITKNAAWQQRVREVGKRIQVAADQPDYKWEFNVLQGKDINAFCLPGGKVAFWEGIVPLCNDDAGIAVVMGHEIAHALAHHGAERMTQQMGTELIGQVIALGLGNASPTVKNGVLQAYGTGAGLAVLPFSRANESEADHIGLILMAKAGYDPRTAVDFWRRMASQGGGGKPPEFLSTHPSDETRIAQIQKWLPEALGYYKKT